MRYPRLGATGMRISEAILGTSGASELLDQQTFTSVVHAALDGGIAAFDTADAYDGGLDEEWLGKALGTRRDRVVISTKVGMRVGATAAEHGAAWHGPDVAAVRAGIGPNDRGLSRARNRDGARSRRDRPADAARRAAAPLRRGGRRAGVPAHLGHR
jgi:aryl-alcohol dehydrogenase-like predicted oxidoreductase